MKVIKSSHISPFGGLNFVIDELDNIGINRLISNELPTLSAQCVYGWRDLLYNFWSMIFCGGDCIEDVGENFKKSIGDHPSLKVPSPDRILDRMKELSIPTELYDTPRGTKKHEFSHNDQLNRLNIKILKRTSTFDHKRKGHILDYDNTLIFTRKADAKMTYKKEFGYAPGVGIIGNHVVYVENRNGNSDAQTLQQDTLQRMFDMLRSEGITVNRFRADGASYQLSTLDVISRNVNKFYARTRMGEGLYKAIERIDNWKPVKDGDQVVYRGDIMFTPFEYIARRNKQEHLLKKYRLVVTKVKRDDGQINLFSGEPYNYYGIITNDYELGNDQIVSFYNQRGAKEK
ncbi:MAG: transposase, partial [Cyclobacteriaceae bacterium]|nr:transposase [Cyclobacteriaceae bacterium]